MRFTLQISDQLNTWLIEQARLNHRTRNKQIEHLLSGAMNGTERLGIDTGKTFVSCTDGKHYFESDYPTSNETCNCGMYLAGEYRQAKTVGY